MTEKDSEEQSSPAEAAPGTEAPPAKRSPTAGQVDLDLWHAVRDTLFALPARFRSELDIEGVLATDLHAFNTSLGASIEEQVVAALNELRGAWDPKDKYPTHRFVRSPQRFPDVTLRSMIRGNATSPLMGIELKGWYVLSKEGEPSGRYKVTPAACAPQDFVVIVPWALGNAVSGTPRLFTPYVESALYVAEYRNWWWQHGRRARTSKVGITSPPDAKPYPAQKSDKISDVPESDSGNNFGRIPRLGIMDDYMTELMRETLSGIPLWAWLDFLRPFAGEAAEEETRRGVADVVRRIVGEADAGGAKEEELKQAIENLVRAARP